MLECRLKDRVGAHKSHATSSKRLLYNSILRLLLNVKVYLGIVHEMRENRELCMHNYILDVFPL